MKKLLLILFCAGLVGCAGNQKLLGENNSVPIKEVGSRTQDRSFPFVVASYDMVYSHSGWFTTRMERV